MCINCAKRFLLPRQRRRKRETRCLKRDIPFFSSSSSFILPSMCDFVAKYISRLFVIPLRSGNKVDAHGEQIRRARSCTNCLYANYAIVCATGKTEQLWKFRRTCRFSREFRFREDPLPPVGPIRANPLTRYNTRFRMCEKVRM